MAPRERGMALHTENKEKSSEKEPEKQTKSLTAQIQKLHGTS